MPREITFRGKKISNHDTNGTWVYGAYLKVGGIANDEIVTKHVIAVQEYPCKETIFHIVEPESVGQSLHWEDGEGETIYEGDFLEVFFRAVNKTASEILWVEWSPTNFRFTTGPYGFDDTLSCLIIGNKTENPELEEAINAAK